MKRLALSLVLAGFALPGCVDDAPDDVETQAIEARRLGYQAIDITAGPASLDGWSPVGLADDGAVYGQGFDCNDDFTDCTLPLVKRARGGAFTVLHPNFLVTDVDEKGDVGGCTIDDPATFFGHAAVVKANGALTVIPARPGELTACVTKIATERVMSIDSFDGDFALTSYVLDKGAIAPLPAGGSVTDLNAHGQASGITFADGSFRGFRFDAATGATTTLAPVAGDPDSWAMGINRHGEVLGYSFVGGGIERIGRWSTTGQFQVAFTEGTPEVPTVSNQLAWNEDGLIVISRGSNDPNTYVVPSPGVRINLADLVVGGDVPTTLLVPAVNRGGDILGFSLDDGRSVLFVRE